MADPVALPTADQAFGARPLPHADEAFPPPVNTNAVALGGADMDEHFSQGSVGQLLDWFGRGARDGWGTKPLGLDPETDAFLKKYAPDYGVVGRAFHDEVVRPAAAALDFAMRAPGAVAHGIYEVAPVVGGPLLAGMEAFPAGHLTGFPKNVPTPQAFARAADLGVIGKGEAGYQDLPTREAVEALSPTGRPSATEAVARPARPTVETSVTLEPQEGVPASEVGTTTAAGPLPAPDIHADAREMAPDTFAEYDALSARRDTFRRWLGELSDTRANGEQAQAIQSRIDDILGKVNGVEGRLTKAAAQRLQAARAELDDFLRSDTPDMARVRQDLQKTDFAMRDLAPDVSAAYRKAAEQVPAEPAAEPPAPQPAAEAVQAPEAVAAPEIAPKPEPAATAAAGEPPLAKGMVRLYRGETDLPTAAAVPDWLKDNPEFKGTVDATGRWFSASREEAEHYNAVHGAANGKISFVDVPADAAKNWLSSAQPEVARFSAAGRAEEEYFLPREIADRRKPIAPSAEAPKPPTEPLEGGIAGDMSRQLVTAGRPAEEAQAAAALVQAHYEARAERFGGTKGTAEDLYRAEAPNVRAGRGVKAAEVEYAQKGELGQPEAPKTAAFRKWFGESKVADDAGEPTRVYHGTNQPLERFDQERRGASTTAPSARAGFFFTDAPEVANDYARLAGERTRADVAEYERKGAALKAEADRTERVAQRSGKSADWNRHYEAMQAWEDHEIGSMRAEPEIGQNIVPVYLSIKNPLVLDAKGGSHLNLGPHKTLTDAIEAAKAGGHDGLIIRNLVDAPTALEPATHYVAFEPEQIKSATGNRGTFSGKSPNILEQTRRGKIRLATDDAKATITLFKDADASTFIHETGHHWLEELIRDAADERAPEDLRADAATVRQWLGVEDGADIPTRAHEKFARGFERYMMEGHAPSAKLAEVFAKFRDWLTRIYETVAGLRSPINDDIRGVFDRMLASKNEGEAVVAPERPTGTFADIHEADAEHTLPPQAGETAALVRTERDTIGEAAHPEIQDERVGARAPIEDAGSASRGGLSGQGGTEGRADAGSAGRVSKSGAVGEGGSKAPAKSTGPSEQPSGPHAEFGPADDGLIDKAGNIRLDNLNAPDDIDAVIREAADRNGGFDTERRGIISDGQMLDLADAVGKDPAFLDAKKIGQAFNGEEILAARKLLIQSSTAVRDAMSKAALGGDAELAQLAQAIARHEMIQGKVSQATAEWGRAGRAFRALEGWEQARDLNQFLKQNGGRDLNQLSAMARLGKFLNTPGQVSKFIADTSGGKVRQAIIYYWVNTLISGPITHLTYSVGNAVNALWTPLVETPVAATSGAIREALGVAVDDRVYFHEVSAQLYGLGKGFRDGLATAVQAYKTGVSPLLPGERIPSVRLDAGLTQPIPGPIGYAIGVSGRAVSAIHSFFKSVRYEQNIQALAMRDALSKGLDGNARDLHIAKLTETPTPEMMDSAAGDALKELYMRPQPYNSPGAYLTRATNSWLPAKILAPFVKIGSDIVRNAFAERTPLGFGSSEVRGNLLMREGGAAFDTQLGKVMAGTGLMGATVLSVLEGSVTGDGPADPNERRIWLLNHTPNSVAVGPLTFSYARLGHLGMLVRFAANMTETSQRWNDEEGSQLARSFFEGITRSVLDETWMRGVKDFFDAIYHSEEHFDRWMTGFVAQWTPFSIGLGQVARKIDPYQRETRDLSTASEILNQIKAHTPLWSQTLPPRRDVFGEPITNGSGTVDRYAQDKVAMAMNELHIGLATPQKKIRGVPLTPEQYDDYSRIGGRFAKMQLDAIIGPGFAQLPPETRIKMIKETVTHARESAATQVMMQSSGGPNDIIAKATDAKAAALQGASPLEVKEKLKAR